MDLGTDNALTLSYVHALTHELRQFGDSTQGWPIVGHSTQLLPRAGKDANCVICILFAICIFIGHVREARSKTRNNSVQEAWVVYKQ